MDMHCPNCENRIQLPDHAVGRRARCRGCGHKFVVPAPENTMEETISGWIVEDVSEIERLRQEHERLFK